MNKRGFTLFELLIIILILSLIGGTGIIIFVNTLKSSKVSQYNMITNQLIEASKVFVETDKEKLSELNNIGYINIKVGDLQEAGFVDWNLINPITDEQISSTYYISAVKSPASIIVYEYHGENLSPDGGSIFPTITLNGDSEIYICNGVYNESGAYAESVIEGDISYKIQITGVVDPQTTGTYELTYSVTGINGKTSSVIRTIIVSYEAPVIILNGSDTVEVTNGIYNDPGAVANSCPDGDITANIEISGNVDLPNKGTYTRTYTITDSTGQSAFVTRIINAVDNTSPSVAFGTNGSPCMKTGSTTVTVTDPTAPTSTYSGVDTNSLKYQWTTTTSTPSEASFNLTFTNGTVISTSGVTEGSYYLWILSKDNSDNTTITRSNIFTLDNIGPEIAINGSNPAYIGRGSNYIERGVTATDALCGIDSVASSSINENSISTQQVTYTVTDNAGNQSTATRTVYVQNSVLSILETVFSKTMGGCTPASVSATVGDIDADSNCYWYGGTGGMTPNANNYVYFNCDTYPSTGCQSWRIIGAKIDTSGTIGVRILAPAGVAPSMNYHSADNVMWDNALIRTTLNNGSQAWFKDNIEGNKALMLISMKTDVRQSPNNSFSNTKTAYVSTTTTNYVLLPSFMDMAQCSNSMNATNWGASPCWSIADSTDVWHWIIGAYYSTSYSYDRPGSWVSMKSANKANYSRTTSSNAVRPAVNLAPWVRVVGGTGTSANPYQLDFNIND